MATTDPPTLSERPTLAELLAQMQRAGGRFGRALEEDRGPYHQELAACQVMYHAVRLLDASPEPITQEQADRICSVVASRVGQ